MLLHPCLCVLSSVNSSAIGTASSSCWGTLALLHEIAASTAIIQNLSLPSLIFIFFFSLYLISPLPDLQFCFLVLPARISHSYQKLLLYTRKSLITSVFRTEPFFLFYSRDKRDRKTHNWVVPHFPVTVSCHCNHQTTPTNFFPVLFLPLARKHLWTQIHHCCVGKR